MTRRSDFSRFDQEYYDRFYQRPETRASSPEDLARQAAFVLSYLDYLELPVRNVLDLGCGLGRWKSVLNRRDSSIRYTGVDPSPYLCREHGWIQATADSYQSRRRYDLVICQDVLAYLTPRQIKDAVANIARLCRGAAYIQVVTREDWDNGLVDPDRTDHAMHSLNAGWYRKVLGRHFVNCGGGVFVPKDTGAVLWELEKI